MGLHTMGSSSTYDKCRGYVRGYVTEMIVEKPVYISNTDGVKKLPNPDPFNYVINKSYIKGKYLLVDIVYPDCTNYEGRKFLLYKNTTIVDLEDQKHIDPHFSSNKRFHSPIARFEPTEDGWDMAMKLMDILNN